MSQKGYNIKEIQEIIPHRYPFLLIDKIVEIVPGEKAIGIKNVTMNEYFFKGHYPDEPIMPGVLIVEALAQVGAVAILDKDEFKGKKPIFGGIKKARFRKVVVPGDTILLSVEMVKIRGQIGVGNAVATVDGEVVCKAELTFAIVD